MKVGTRTLITFEAAADWRAEREAATTAPRTQGAAHEALPPNQNGYTTGTKPIAEVRALTPSMWPPRA